MNDLALALIPRERLIDETIREARDAAELFCRWYRMVVGETGKQVPDVPLDFALRMAAWIRLIQLERAGHLAETENELPSLQDVEQDVVRSFRGQPCMHKGHDIIGKILWIRITRMCWKAMPGMSLGLMLRGTLDHASLHEIARFLWKHRRTVNRE